MKLNIHLSIKGLLTKLSIIESETHKEVVGGKIENVSFVIDPRFGSSMSFDLELPTTIDSEYLKEPHYD